MRIAILTSGILPVPAVQGGAVENLTDFYLEYNDRQRLHDITVYSVWHPRVERHPALLSAVNHYRYIKVTGLMARLRRKLYHLTHGPEYYHYTIEYYLSQAMADIARHRYDLIILENRPAYALKLRAVTRSPLVYHLHNDKLTTEAPRCHDIYNAATRILTVSDYIRRGVQAISPGDAKTVTVYNGIDLTAFTPADPAPARAGAGFAADDFILVFSGRVTPEKGILQLIDAMLLLADKPRLKLLVIGSSFYGNDDNSNPFGRLLASRAAPLSGRIRFTGFVPYSQMPHYLSMADAAVVPSVWDDPFPTTVLEAQAMGLPVIATRRGGIPEEVTDESAILIDTDSHFTANLAGAISHLYSHPDRCRAMARAARHYSPRFDKWRYARDFFEALPQPSR